MDSVALRTISKSIGHVMAPSIRYIHVGLFITSLMCCKTGLRLTKFSRCIVLILRSIMGLSYPINGFSIALE